MSIFDEAVPARPAREVPSLKPGEMILEPDPQYGWHLAFTRSGHTVEKPKVKQAYYTQAQLTQLMQLALTRLGASLDEAGRGAFLAQVQELMTPARKAPRRKGAVQEPADGAAPSASAQAAARAAAK